jgi:hypothetical protein
VHHGWHGTHRYDIQVLTTHTSTWVHRYSSLLAAKMWTTMKNNLLGKKFLSCSFYLYRYRKYMSYGFPIINFCNPGVHDETPCTVCQTGTLSLCSFNVSSESCTYYRYSTYALHRCYTITQLQPRNSVHPQFLCTFLIECSSHHHHVHEQLGVLPVP